MVNKVILIGRLGRDVESKQTSSGTSIATFSLATDELVKKDNGKKEVHTEWHRITAFGKLAEHCVEHLRKGRLVYVEGKLRTSKYEDKDGITRYITEVYASTIKFLDSKKTDASGDEEDEVPF